MNRSYLANWRLAHGLSQAALAKLLGVHPVTVARWECGMREITPQTAAQIQRLMDTYEQETPHVP